jgi:hypothetical protein
MSISVLNEIKDLPTKITNPNWLDELDESEEIQDKPARRGKAKR